MESPWKKGLVPAPSAHSVPTITKRALKRDRRQAKFAGAPFQKAICCVTLWLQSPRSRHCPDAVYHHVRSSSAGCDGHYLASTISKQRQETCRHDINVEVATGAHGERRKRRRSAAWPSAKGRRRVGCRRSQHAQSDVRFTRPLQENMRLIGCSARRTKDCVPCL